MKTVALAIVISLALAFATAGQAQDPQAYTPQNTQYVTVQPGSRIVLDSPAPQPARDKGPVCDWFCRHFGPRCFGHHDEALTGNICSESVFIFGSSRAYFGEPCRPIPPGYYGCGPGRYGWVVAPCANGNCANGACGRQ